VGTGGLFPVQFLRYLALCIGENQSMKKYKLLYRAIIILFLSSLAACTPKDQAGKTVEQYLNALVNKDVEQMVSLSCSEWEEGAVQQADSFQAVKTQLEDLSCKETGIEGDFSLVTCSGSLVATYDAEEQVFPLDRQLYLVTNNDGDWCIGGTR
jgi:hypothetical protein